MSQDSQRPVRVRFAPSPTGALHIGGARTALFNWAFARKHGGSFVLRVEDTDHERSKPEFEQAILNGLRWLGMDWDEGPEAGGEFGPYRQSERLDRHLGVAATLFQAGWAYRCFCSSERLTKLRAEQMASKGRLGYDGHCKHLSDEECEAKMKAGAKPVLRFRVPEGHTIFSDGIRGDVRFDNSEVDDWIMVRADGSPTYNFVVVCDDADMEITHVIRGEDHLTNTPKQVLLYGALGVPVPHFAHLPLMLGSDKKKLSKRTADTSLQVYRDLGYPRDAVVNFLCLQGWALDGATEVFSREQLIEHFELSAVSKGGAVFDLEKFRWLAAEYLRGESADELVRHCAPQLVAAGLLTEDDVRQRADWICAALESVRERISLYSEAPEQLRFLFADASEVEYDPKAEKNARKRELSVLAEYLNWLRPKLSGEVDTAALRDATKAWIGERELKFPDLFQPLRCALTGQAGGPDLFDVMALLGNSETLGRIEAGLRRLV